MTAPSSGISNADGTYGTACQIPTTTGESMQNKTNLPYLAATAKPSINATSTPPLEDRRRLTDRRHSHRFINWRSLGFAGRRRHHRRQDRHTNPRVDWYHPRLMIAAIGIIVLSGCDAFFTLKLLNLGAVELNIIMAQLIEQDVATFVRYKIALTCLSTLLMVIFCHVRIAGPLRVHHLLWVILIGYGALIFYELVLLSLLLS